jgi:hypothetical protein
VALAMLQQECDTITFHAHIRVAHHCG